MVIDMHSHFFPESWPDLAERFGGSDWPWIRHQEDGKAMVMVGDAEFRPIYSACWNVEKRLEEMDLNGVDYQVFCATPVLFCYQRSPKHAAECARIFNDAALEMRQLAPERLGTFCQVPLQDIDLACRELSQAMKDGHMGVQIGTHVGDKGLDDEGIITFLQHCASENAPVLVHPWDIPACARMTKHMLPWLVGMPSETQLAMLSLLLSGAIERLPESLRLCFAHGGGSFPYLLGRADNAWHERDIVRIDSPRPPSEYTGRFFVDSAVFDHRALRLLVDVMGIDQIMLGTDYPFPLGEKRMGSLVRESSLSDEQKDKILHRNAAGFLGLASSDMRPPVGRDTNKRGEEAHEIP